MARAKQRLQTGKNYLLAFTVCLARELCNHGVCVAVARLAEPPNYGLVLLGDVS